MKKIVLVVLSVLTILQTNQAQTVLDAVYEKEHYENREPQKYPALREADVMWSRKIWREIDLKQKINHPFYYPVNADQSDALNDRKSLIDVVMDAITLSSCCEAKITDINQNGNILAIIKDYLIFYKIQSISSFTYLFVKDSNIQQ